MSILSETLNHYQKLANKRRKERRERSLEFQEISKRADVSYNTVKGIMEGTTSKPKNQNLQNIVAVFIEEGVISSVEDIRRIWEAADRGGQVDEAWFQDTLADVRRRGIAAYDEKKLQSLMEPNPRGVSLADAIEAVGLVDIEKRDDGTKRLPPGEIYKVAKREIAMSGLSLYNTFTTDDGKLVRDALAAKKSFYALLLSPGLDEDEFESLKQRENGRNVKRDILQVIEIIEGTGLYKDRNFQIKFLEKVPPFTAVMIDGDIEPKDKADPQDPEGQIRVQSSSVYGSQHEAPVLQFKKILGLGDVDSTFDYYAKDLRKQWDNGVSLDVVLKWLRESGR